MANAFINFSNQHRQRLRDENPDLSMTEIAKLLGSMWRQLSQEEKDRYRDEAYMGDEEEDEDDDEEEDEDE